MDKVIKRYYELKKKLKETEQELIELREQILSHCSEQGVKTLLLGNYEVKIVAQERREYDDEKLYKALPDSEVWRMVSKADSTKIASLVKLKVIKEDILQNTYSVKKVSSLQVERK
ncbi:MAG: hypothetical protein P0Y55_11000 [Candidatus Cohnella colombiensis]|uniref:Uncharacterized protein n=1 Tax=Candidatus Cohnella colombiensis TaxID=3121368 RepID=A0AA95JBR0_9BACL|nr:MAG: hypothetical protein P0Y55_11000 [Cohnella sp.]